MLDPDVRKIVGPQEWSLTVDGIEPTEASLLCELLRADGHAVVLRAGPLVPACRLALASGAITARSAFPDDARKSSDIEIKVTRAFRAEQELLPQLVECVTAVLERTLAYWALVKAVRSGKAIAFVGSGLSVAVKYPTWKTLLKILCEEAAIPFPELGAESEQFLELAEQCKGVLAGRYEEILAREFGEKTPGYGLLHSQLIAIRFAAFMTTNFDPCLEVAAELGRKPTKVQVWPDFIRTRIEDGDIYHLHGKVPQKGDSCKISRIRLTTADYSEAYPADEESPAVIADLVKLAIEQQMAFLFVGYGLRELVLRKILKDGLARSRKLMALLEKHVGGGKPPQVHFALIPEGQFPEAEMSALLADCKVQVIEFSTSNNYEELGLLIVDLLRRTEEFKRPPIFGLGGDTEPDLSGVGK